MKHKLYSLLLTALFGITGMQAWGQDLSTTEIDGVTYYEIGNAADLVAFAGMVNGGETSANGLLTADIDLADAEWTPIGNADAQYSGTFDGQRHAIKNFSYEATSNYNGVFGFCRGATIKNFSISGTLISSGFTKNGVVGNADATTVSGIYSSLTIDVSDYNAHTGGIVGGDDGNVADAVLVENCEYSGTLTHSGLGDCQAGILGYTGYGGVKNCIFSGTIIGYGATKYGGILAYCKRPEFIGVQNCLSIGTIIAEEPQYAAAIIANWNGNATSNVKNNYYYMQEGSSENVIAIGNKTANCEAPHAVTPEQIASGEVCYLLNGSQSEDVAFYQTLPGDAQPTVDATHGIVYMNGRLHCNGTPYDGASYSNENAGVIQDDHDIVDGFCSYCGLFDENYMTPNADGFFEIATAKQLVWFEQLVNKGTFDANAVLTADIDFADLMSEEDKEDIEKAQVAWTPIGDWGQIRGTGSACYKGHFDGQGHTIKNFNVTSNCNYYGIFGVISEGSLIENFDIFGTLNLGHKTGGVVGYTRDTACTIRYIHSFLTLNVTEAATTAERPGGILGTAVNGTTVIENCTYSGILKAGGHTGNIGGIVGYINNNPATIVNITNCLFDGEIRNGDTADGQCGGIVGYNNGGVATIKNCLSVGTIVASDGNIGQIIGRLNGSNTTFANNYYLGEFVNGTESGKSAKGAAPVQVDTDQLGSGEVAWKLNGETFLDVVWRQTINEEEYPKPYGDGAVVYQTPTGYDCIDENDPASFGSFISSVTTVEEEFLEDIIAYQPLLNEYKQAIEAWQSIDSYEEFLAAYKASFELKERIKESAANYKMYMAACEAAANEEIAEGEWKDFLKVYLEEYLEPSKEYPNGTYKYIIEERNLDDEALAAEIAFVDQMLQNAIAGGITSGTEITRLFANSSFANGFEGWTVESDEGITMSYGGTTEIMPIARGGGKGAFDVSQSLAELPNGIYLMSIHAMFRPDTDILSRFYAGQIYMNGTANYAKVPGEDVLPEDDAEPGVNCIGVDNGDKEYLDDVIGLVPNNMNAASYAFNAGRYQNLTAAEVTDGNLTVGVRSLGTGLASDWMPFGDLHVYYLGTAEEADEELAEVLKAYADRAQTIVDFEYDDYDEYAKKPNISESLKEQLGDAIEEIEDAADGKAKLALINKFSKLFNEVHACRMAYIDMFAAANKLYDQIDALSNSGLIDDDTYNYWDDKINEARNSFSYGDVSAEEAQAIAEELKSANLLPIAMVDGVYQLAKAEDVRFFSVLVSSGSQSVKAVLTADIDMSELDEEAEFMPIGSTGTPFTGEFDGQGHTITNFGKFVVEDEETGEGYYTLSFSGSKMGEGFFGCISGATVKNFSIEGTFEVAGGNYKGAIGQALKSTVSNVHSALNINVTASGCHHCGGVVGSTEGDAGTTISGCSFSGTLTVAAGSTDNFAGILGYSGGDAVQNCANYGTITFSDAGCAAGGIVGYINNTTTYVQNCLNVGTVKYDVSDAPKYGGAIIGRIKNNWSNTRVVNNYWLEGSAYGPARKDDGTSPEAASANGSTAEQMASGEVCFKLNGDQSEINWFQTLGADEYPVLFDTHKIVYMTQDGTYTNDPVTTPDGSEENPFVVKSAADLCNLINLLVSGRMNYVVMEEDVDMAGVTDWTPLFNIPEQPNGYPYIDFDGKGHIISNLTSNTTGQYDYCGLFGVLCGNVRNLGVENADVTCTGGTGIIAGYLGHSTYGKPCYIENVWVSGKVTAAGYCGGMFGNVANEAHITNCYANVEVNGSSDLTGGIIGRVRAEVIMNNVYAAGSINLGGGIIGGGFQDATPAGTYNNIAVWNNTQNNFGPARDNENLGSIIYYDGTNFAEMQSQVVAWDPNVWYCDMKEGSYPVLYDVATPDGIRNIQMAEQPASGSIYNLAGQRMSKMQKGINIVQGKKILVK